MQPVVETVTGLERRVELAVSMADVEKEVQSQLKRVARTAKAPGFRPGKVPLAILERSHGPSLRMDALNNQLGNAFEQAVKAAELRVAGSPNIEPRSNEDAPAEGEEGTLTFVATFEVYPEVAVPALDAIEAERFATELTDADVDRTIDILRKQRVTHEAREGRAAEDNDRVTIDFAGTIDGVAFEGGKAEDFPFVLGQGRMLPEFEDAVRGLKAGETKVFPLNFPADYGSETVAGKQAEFTITVKEVAEGVLPEVDAEFAKSLGQAEGDIEKLRADIRTNLQREVTGRVHARTKSSVMDALLAAVSFDVPKALIENDIDGRIAAARQDLAQRGLPNADQMPIPREMFAEESQRRVRLGLLVSELVRAEGLQPKPEQVRARIEEFAQSYENPAEVVHYYLSDRERRAEIEAVVLEDNVVEFVLGKAKVTDTAVPFEELMGQNAAR